MTDSQALPAERRALHRSLYLQVLAAILAGVLLGAFAPATAVAMKPLGDGFLKLIKMVIAPVILLTVSLGIAGMRDMKQLGRVGLKAVVYFEGVSTLALVVGLVVVNWMQPGKGFNANPASLDASAVAQSAHEFHRQRRRHGGGQSLGGRARPSEGEGSSRPQVSRGALAAETQQDTRAA